jgi:2-dehydropantoate 2-reductase
VLAARLHLAGVDVQAVAVARTVGRDRARGLRLLDPARRGPSSPLRAARRWPTSTSTRTRPCVVTVKSHQTAAVIARRRAAHPPEVTVVSGQNGVANEETLQRTRRTCSGMVVMMPTSHLEPGSW